MSDSNAKFRTLTLLVLLAGSVLLTGCLGPWDQKQSALDPRGPLAQDQYNTFMVTLYVTGFLFVTVGGTLLYTVWRFRSRKTDDPNTIPKQSHGHPVIELGLVLASAAMLVVIAVPTIRGIVYMENMPKDLHDDAIVINVTGLQWWWEFEYPEEGIVTANEMYIPAGRAVHLNLRADDVIHSFWVPKLAGKKDLIPGQENEMWMKADEPGYFYGQCAEFCGDSHAYMLFRVIAVPEEEYRAWIEKYQEGPAIDIADPGAWEPDDAHEELIGKGIDAFRRHCVSCHRVGDQGGLTGPNLSHFGSRTTLAAGWLDNNPENLHRWLAEPERVKPGNLMYYGLQGMTGLKDIEISDEEIEAMVAFLLALE